MDSKARVASLLGPGLVLALALAAAAVLAGAGQEIPGPLSAFHAAKPGESDCAACHTAPGKVSPAKCLACHTEIASRIAAQTGFHRDKAEDCAVCHAEHQGRQANIVPLDPSDFDHSETGADLQGAHLRPSLRRLPYARRTPSRGRWVGPIFSRSRAAAAAMSRPIRAGRRIAWPVIPRTAGRSAGTRTENWPCDARIPDRLRSSWRRPSFIAATRLRRAVPRIPPSISPGRSTSTGTARASPTARSSTRSRPGSSST